MNRDRLLDEWSERIERGLTGYSFEDRGAAETDADLSRSARFLIALMLDVLNEKRGPEFTRQFLRAFTGAETEAQDDSAGNSLAELHMLSEMSASCRMMLAILGLAEGRHQYRRFVESGLGLGRTLQSLRNGGVSAEQCAAAIAKIHIRLVATAHPTNIFRSIILGARQEIFALIDRMNDPAVDDVEFALIVSRLRERLTAKIATRFERWVKPDVLDEVRQVVGYFRSTIYHVAPAVLARLKAAFLSVYGCPLQFRDDAPLCFGSWVGGDMDGNPFVNAEVYRQAVEVQRSAALEMFSTELSRTAPALSMAMSPQLRVDELVLSIERDLQSMRTNRLDTSVMEQFLDREPFRLKMELMRCKVERSLRHNESAERGEGFRYWLPGEAMADLVCLRHALSSNGFESTAQEFIDPLQLRLQMFGFHLASIDLREDSLHIGRAARLALYIAGHRIDPAQKSEKTLDGEEYRRLLTQEILNPRRIDMRRILPDSVEQSEEGLSTLFESESDYHFVQRIYAMLEAARDAQRCAGIQCTSNLILTMTSCAEDILHALLLLKSAGLFLRRFDGQWRSSIDIVPLFETIEDLHSAERIMTQVFANEAYAEQLSARGRRQTMMLGFSDSNKDGGYFASNWSIYRAQTVLLKLAESRGVNPRFFYGRGGSIGRGGASSRHVANSLPPGAICGGYDLTEQGEVLSRYYVTREVAGMHLETILSAAIEKNAAYDSPPAGEFLDAAEELFDHSRDAYRALVHEHPALVSYFEDCTPREVELVKIGSRPVRRRAMRSITDLRAIPWVFRWYQSRQFLPGWYGLGTALGRLIESRGLEFVRRLCSEWRFMQAILENSALALSQSNLAIAARFRDLAVDAAGAASVFAAIKNEFEICRRQIEQDLNCRPERFFRNEYPVLFAAQQLKQPWVDSLGELQVVLLRRYRELQTIETDGSAALQLAREAVVSSIEGVALGLGATG